MSACFGSVFIPHTTIGKALISPISDERKAGYTAYANDGRGNLYFVGPNNKNTLENDKNLAAAFNATYPGIQATYSGASY